MLKLLQLILIGHIHDWKITEVVPTWSRDWGAERRYYWQCQHCAKIKVREI